MLTATRPPAAGIEAGLTTSQATWSPYDNNGGTCVAIAGADYCLAAATTRLSTGLNILSRDANFVEKISNHCVILSAGCQADAKALQKHMRARHVMYQHQHNKPMTCQAVAQLLSNTMYYKRFFPYYTETLCAGLDKDGSGLVYSYDAMGSAGVSGYACRGTGESLIQPVLDNQLMAASPLVLPVQPSVSHLPLERALDILKDAFTSAGERDILTGDAVEILILTKEGTRTERMELKKD
eukprot:evm.model.scf_1596.3 EVM.evm.TU.scf_1596.3   scf_1596:25941-32036(-)